MKKTTLIKIILLTAMCATHSYSSVVVRDITDFTFTAQGQSLNFDFNLDGVNEFTFQRGSSVGTFFNDQNVNFITAGTISNGYGWDVIKALTSGIIISNTSNFAALGDAYINPSWANTADIFPTGDSYIGTTFKIGNNRHYGWILVNLNAGIVTVKSYAYETNANQSIVVGQLLSTNDYNQEVGIVLLENPVKDFLKINITDKNATIIVSDLSGRIYTNQQYSQEIGIANLPKGMYILSVFTENKKTKAVKFLKE